MPGAKCGAVPTNDVGEFHFALGRARLWRVQGALPELGALQQLQR